MLAHLERGSVRVTLHQHIRRGETLGLLGNSGQSTAPHLHFQVTDGNSPLSAEGVPYVLMHFDHVGYAADFEEGKHPTLPRSRALPADGEVVGLPRRDAAPAG